MELHRRYPRVLLSSLLGQNLRFSMRDDATSTSSRKAHTVILYQVRKAARHTEIALQFSANKPLPSMVPNQQQNFLRWDSQASQYQLEQTVLHQR